MSTKELATTPCIKCGSAGHLMMGSRPHPADARKSLHAGYIVKCISCPNQTKKHATAAEAVEAWHAGFLQ